MKHANVGDVVYHINDKLKENAYVVVLRDTVLNRKGEKIYKYLVNPITNGRQDKTITIYFYESSLVLVPFTKTRSTKLITERMLYNMLEICLYGMEIQWCYKSWKNIIKGLDNGINIVRFTDSYSNVVYAIVTEAKVINIPNCNDRKDDIHSYVSRVRIKIQRLL